MSDRLLPHQILGRYQLLVPVARGGMGQVWLGRLQGARGFSKLVAIKTVLPHEEDRPRLEAMLAEEARLAALVEHPNVVHTIELGEQAGVLYLVMEWVDGEPLGSLHARAEERGGMPLSIAVSLVSQVLDGLHAAHELCDDAGPLGLVHRDVSPHNVLVTYDGVAKLLDFGIAKATEQSTGHTELGEIKGKFSYMAPEQLLGEDVDRRCDVFAAGIVLYWLTTGHHPFKHANTATVIHAITSPSPVAPPSSVASGFPEELARVVQKALAKAREDRFASAEEMRAALERAVPEAFGDAGRSALAAYVAEVVGERKAARREAIRRAQLAADGATVPSSGALMSVPSQSASSLGAISLSRPAPGLDASRGEPGASVSMPRRREPLAPRLAAAAGVLLALASLLPRLLAGPPRATATAAGAPSGAALMVEEPARVVAPAPAVASPSASAPPPLAAASAKRAAPRTAKVKPLGPPKSLGPSSADLLAPDY